MAEEQLFYVGLKAFISKGKKILIVFDPILGLDYPGGKIQENETDFIASLKREVKEETELEISVGDPFHVWHYTFPKGHRNSGKKLCYIAYKCRHLAGEVKLSSEHNKFKWYDISSYKELEEDSPFYEALQKYFQKFK